MSDRPRDPDFAAAVVVLVALTFVGLAVLGGFFLGRATMSLSTGTVAVSTPATAAVDPNVAAGAHGYVNFACAQRHWASTAGEGAATQDRLDAPSSRRADPAGGCAKPQWVPRQFRGGTLASRRILRRQRRSR